MIPEKYRACQPNKIETIDWLCRAALERLGFATAGEIANYWETVSKPEAQQWCRANLGNGLREIEIECTETDKPRSVFAFDNLGHAATMSVLLFLIVMALKETG